MPEIRLHLITEACPLWHASEAEAGAAGLVEPYWVFCWPGGQALARYLLDHPEVVAGKRVLDFGSGCAVEAIGALKSGAASALCADIDPLAALAAQERRAQRRLAGDHDPQLDWGEHRRRRRPRRRRLLRQGLAAAALDWLRGLDALVLIGDPARGFLDTSTLRQVASYRAGADGDSGAALRESSVFAFAECRWLQRRSFSASCQRGVGP